MMTEFAGAQATIGTSTPGDRCAVGDEAAVEAFMEKVLGDYVGANAFFMGAIGDRLGLFAELSAAGAATSSEFAQRTGLDERYLREWLGDGGSGLPPLRAGDYVLRAAGGARAGAGGGGWPVVPRSRDVRLLDELR